MARCADLWQMVTSLSFTRLAFSRLIRLLYRLYLLLLGNKGARKAHNWGQNESKLPTTIPPTKPASVLCGKVHGTLTVLVWFSLLAVALLLFVGCLVSGFTRLLVNPGKLIIVNRGNLSKKYPLLLNLMKYNYPSVFNFYAIKKKCRKVNKPVCSAVAAVR